MRDYWENIMASKKCKKCHSHLSNMTERCQNCGAKQSNQKKIMAWFCIILLFLAGIMWAFTDSEPDVTIVPTPDVEVS